MSKKLITNNTNINEKDLMEFLNMNGFSQINEKTKMDFIKLSMALGLNPFSFISLPMSTLGVCI